MSQFSLDKKCLSELFLSDRPSQHVIDNFRKLVNMIIAKHFSGYFSQREEFYHMALAYCLESRNLYDPSYSAYNYAYTKTRNVIGNYIHKKKEIYVPEILPISNASISPSFYVELPSGLSKLSPYLLGKQTYSMIEISQKQVIDLLYFCLSHHQERLPKLPSHVKNGNKDLQILYKIASII